MKNSDSQPDFEEYTHKLVPETIVMRRILSIESVNTQIGGGRPSLAPRPSAASGCYPAAS